MVLGGNGGGFESDFNRSFDSRRAAYALYRDPLSMDDGDVLMVVVSCEKQG